MKTFVSTSSFTTEQNGYHKTKGTAFKARYAHDYDDTTRTHMVHCSKHPKDFSKLYSIWSLSMSLMLRKNASTKHKINKENYILLVSETSCYHCS